MRFLLFNLLIFSINVSSAGDVETRTMNNGNLVLENIPSIPAAISNNLNRYQHVRSAGFVEWSADSQSILIRTRFGEVAQLHKVAMPMGARQQITFFDEPIGSVQRRPEGDELTFTMDAGGNEFAQIFLLDPENGGSVMLTDGESRNGSVTWDNAGTQIAYLSTARNGSTNDVWLMDTNEPESRKIAFEARDGTYWFPVDFNDNDDHLIIGNYVSIVNSSFFLLNLDTGEATDLRGDSDNPSVNSAIGFDRNDEGIFFLTDEGTEFTQLAYLRLDNPNDIRRITGNINWNVAGLRLSEDKTRGAFIVNAGGIDELYLLDPESFRYTKVTGLPIGLVGGLTFSPDGTRLALTLNTPRTPSDVFVLKLGKNPLDYEGLTRWTESEVGGLSTRSFVEPELISYKTFDGRQIPAFFYKPEGEGPHPVVVSIHGGPEGQARPAFNPTYQMWLQELGVALLIPNVRGSSGYGKTYVQLDNGFKREDSVKDIGALLDWIAGEASLDSDRVAVFGGSYGGYMVLAASVHYSDRLAAAVDIVGISNFVTFLQNTQDYRRDARRQEYGDERDPAMYEHLQKISPLNQVGKIKIPMLVVQGENDPRVPVTEATQLVNAMRANGQAVWYMNALNEGHGYRKKENRDVYQEVTAMFLAKYLGKK